MNIVNKNEGVKIPHTLSKAGKITLNDELMLNLPLYQRDHDVHLIISKNAYGMLVIGAGKWIVAELDIPARSYDYVEDGKDEDGGPKLKKVAQNFDISVVTLTLWALEV